MSKSATLFCLFLLALPLAAQTTAPAAKPTATFHTTAGDMTCELFPDKVPNGVANFVGLATGSKTWKNPKTGKTMTHAPLYDGTIFHRVIPNFMVQGGDPLGDGTGGPGFEMADEIVPTLTFEVPGRLAYANSGPNTNGSQFFITEVPTPHLNGHYVIFGQCDDATVELVKKIARMPRDERNDRPAEPVKITSITITGMKTTAAAKPVHKTKARMKADKLAQAQ
jgi:peptidyl-prolyl cis-trans isomerase A (cyclophilin A)